MAKYSTKKIVLQLRDSVSYVIRLNYTSPTDRSDLKGPNILYCSDGQLASIPCEHVRLESGFIVTDIKNKARLFDNIQEILRIVHSHAALYQALPMLDILQVAVTTETVTETMTSIRVIDNLSQ